MTDHETFTDDQRAAIDIRQMAAGLNDAISQAVEAGLTVQVTVVQIERMGQSAPWPLVEVHVSRVQEF